MIIANNVTLKFGSFTAIDQMSCTIPDGMIFGVIGSNGAGKSTLLRLLSGVYRPHTGEITLDGAPVYNRPDIKQQIAFVPDELYFLPQASMKRMASLYRACYPGFSNERFRSLCDTFDLDPTAGINTFSKGMKRQAATVLALSTMPRYLYLDETFDGLDPVKRMQVKQVLYEDVLERKTTTILTSHSLRELEDTCDQLALMHHGSILLQSDVQQLKTSLFKVQIAFATPPAQEDFAEFDLLSYHALGSVATMILRGDREEITARLQERAPLLLDVLPLNLEEVFLSEMDLQGYNAKNNYM